ncbi:MAG: hypothetical protein C6W59_06410 [Paenibacillaceae bacterium]|nr:MAG: hypothetical protein C6W59_06410 [Paenibacillaceae bacterium]
MFNRNRWRSLLLGLGVLLLGAAGWDGSAGASTSGLFIPIPPDIRIPQPAPDPVVDFPDPKLKQWAVAELGIEGDEIRKSDIDRYCEAFARDIYGILTIWTPAPGKIQSLEGIQAFKPCNVKYLVADRWEIRDVTPVTELTTLRGLDMRENLLEDVRPLGSLTNLSQLSIRNNAIHDLTPIGGLSRMAALDAGGNYIADLSPIASMTQMRTLKVDDNRIRDLEALKNFNDLLILEAHDNWISSLKPIEYLDPREVYLARNRIDTESADNKPAINRWLVRGATVDVSDQNPGKVYPYEDEPPAGGDPVPAGPGAADGTGGASSGTADPGAGVPEAGEPESPAGETDDGEDTEEWVDLPIIRGRHPFADIAGHWAEADIQWAYERGIVNGIGNGKFDPAGITTEEQFLKMLLIAMRGLAEEPVSTPWSRKYYEFALAYGYPVWPEQRSQPITRRAVAELIAAAQGQRLTGDDAIRYLLDKGLSSGKTSATIEGYFGDDYLTRAEAVRFIRNVITKAEHKTPQRLSP